jgi:hypothetical protein
MAKATLATRMQLDTTEVRDQFKKANLLLFLDLIGLEARSTTAKKHMEMFIYEQVNRIMGTGYLK